MAEFKDKRFKKALTLPIFSRVPREQRKTEIDERFSGIFTNPDFAIQQGIKIKIPLK